jgi:glycosyltransferase involved in cell wall biosynthesis
MINSEQFFVSTIIPVHNGEKFLAGAIANVLEQDYQPLEIIIIDDGSTDGTREVAAQFKDKIRYIYQSNSGPAAARNHGIKIAKGNVIAFLDVDDLWSADKLKKQVECLVNNPSVQIVQGLIQQVYLSSTNKEQVYENYAETYQYINLGSSIYQKSVFKKVGLFDEILTYGEDIDWFLRAWENRIDKLVIEEVTLFYRHHQQNMTFKKTSRELGLVKVYKRHLDRNRRNGVFTDKSPPDMPKVSEYIGFPPPPKSSKQTSFNKIEVKL